MAGDARRLASSRVHECVSRQLLPQKSGLRSNGAECCRRSGVGDRNCGALSSERVPCVLAAPSPFRCGPSSGRDCRNRNPFGGVVQRHRLAGRPAFLAPLCDCVAYAGAHWFAPPARGAKVNRRGGVRGVLVDHDGEDAAQCASLPLRVRAWDARSRPYGGCGVGLGSGAGRRSGRRRSGDACGCRDGAGHCSPASTSCRLLIGAPEKTLPLAWAAIGLLRTSAAQW